MKTYKQFKTETPINEGRLPPKTTKEHINDGFNSIHDHIAAIQRLAHPYGNIAKHVEKHGGDVTAVHDLYHKAKKFYGEALDAHQQARSNGKVDG